jgi:hypothetical protein
MSNPDAEQVIPIAVTSLRKEVKNKFGNRVVCLLFYGSHAYSRPRSDGSDYDYYLLLDKPKNGDLQILKSICDKSINSDFSLQYLSVLERRGWNNFQHGNHGAFFLFHLASSITLLGTNIFSRKVMQLDRDTVVNSLVSQIEEYFWRLDHWHINGLKDKELLLSTKKYLVRICQDIMLAKGDISFQEINVSTDTEFVKTYLTGKYYLSKKTTQKLTAFLKIATLSKSKEEYPKLRETLYRDFLNEFYHG